MGDITTLFYILIELGAFDHECHLLDMEKKNIFIALQIERYNKRWRKCDN